MHRLTLMVDELLLEWLRHQAAANQRELRDQIIWVLRQARDAEQAQAVEAA